MTPVTAILFISLALVPASLAGPIPSPGLAPTTIESVSASTGTSTSSADIYPTPVFTLGPSGLPHASAPPTSTTTSRARLEMDWLS